MERIVKKIVNEEICYKAIDGKEFSNGYTCERYEEYLQNEEKVWSEFKFLHYNRATHIFEEIEKPEDFDYAIVVSDEYRKYRDFLPKDFSDLKKVGLYYRNYSDAYNGGCGWNGWELICSGSHYEQILQFFKQFSQTS